MKFSVGGVLVSGVSVCAVLVTGLGSTSAAATGVGSSVGSSGQVHVQRSIAPARPFNFQGPLAREVTRRGDADTSPEHIQHVTELQYRLRWAGVYGGPITGTFGPRTEHAVRVFQWRNRLFVSGVATHRTWSALIRQTLRGRAILPYRCGHGVGVHLCYDRLHHQVTLWKGHRLWNAWLVRGGDRGYETRTGRFSVYWRDRYHVSSIYGSAMPFSQFFSGGEAFHGSPFMMNPFVGHSHGCVNMYYEDARQLWRDTRGVHINVHVYGAWS
ncbi:MAG: L,D-transpeptidase family protein [Nocardioidaceae bacterium]